MLWLYWQLYDNVDYSDLKLITEYIEDIVKCCEERSKERKYKIPGPIKFKNLNTVLVMSF